MTSVDLLGDDGREALNACVKVCICTFSEPSTIVDAPTYSALASERLERIFKTESLSGMTLVPETGYYDFKRRQCELIEEVTQKVEPIQIIDREGKLQREYSPTEATFGDSKNIFPSKRHETKDISVKVCQSYVKGKDTREERQESKRLVDERRWTESGSECATASDFFNIGTGSGFILHNHFIVTSGSVLKTYDEAESHQIRISNAVIGKLPCKVAYQDVAKDLALLYCPDLNLERSGIRPLHLSNQSLLPGMPIFSFGYPMGHAGDTALFVTGVVSKINSSMMSLNCPLNSGNSGGPVISRINNGQLKVVGIVTQKPFKEVLTLEEIDAVEKIRKSLQTNIVNPQPHLTLKLYGILKTHSLLDLSNALPGCLVVEFIRNSTGKYEGEHKEELAKVIEWSIQDEL